MMNMALMGRPHSPCNKQHGNSTHWLWLVHSNGVQEWLGYTKLICVNYLYSFAAKSATPRQHHATSIELKTLVFFWRLLQASHWYIAGGLSIKLFWTLLDFEIFNAGPWAHPSGGQVCKSIDRWFILIHSMYPQKVTQWNQLYRVFILDVCTPNIH